MVGNWTAEANVTEANLTAITWTATQTTFLLTAGAMIINASFITPIEVRGPRDWVARSDLLIEALTLVAGRHGAPVNAVFVFGIVSDIQ